MRRFMAELRTPDVETVIIVAPDPDPKELQELRQLCVEHNLSEVKRDWPMRVYQTMDSFDEDVPIEDAKLGEVHRVYGEGLLVTQSSWWLTCYEKYTCCVIESDYARIPKED